MCRVPRQSLAVYAPLACLLANGCRHGSLPATALEDLAHADGWWLVPGARGVRQEGHADCGAAALDMVLDYWGHGRAPGEITTALLHPGKRTIKAQALRDYARHDGLASYIIQGHHNDLVSEIRAGRPVIVGLWKESVFGDYPHYEVVAGINPTAQLILVFDPAHGWENTRWEDFQREWIASGSVCLVIFPHRKHPGQGG